MRWFSFVLAGLVVTAVPALGHADGVRDGAIVSVGLGIGDLHMDNEWAEGYGATAAFGSVQVGGMISNSVAVFVQATVGSGNSHDLNDPPGYYERLTQASLGAGMRVWLGRKLWLQGAFGSSRFQHTATDSPTREFEGIVGSVALGFELSRHATYALDVQGGLSAGRYDRDMILDDEFFDDGFDRTNTASIGVGLSWF